MPDTPRPFKSESESDDDIVEIVNPTPTVRSVTSKHVKREDTRKELCDTDIIEILDHPALDAPSTSSAPPAISNAHVTSKKRKRAAPMSSEVIEISDDDYLEEAPAIKRQDKGKGKAPATPGRTIKITRQLRVNEIIPLDSIPSSWTVPAPECNIAYLLDVRSDKREWKDTQGELLSMSGIIKSQVSHSYGS